MDKFQEVELLDFMVLLFIIFWGTSILFSRVVAPIYIPTNRARGFPVLHTLPNTSFLVFLIMAFLTGVRWHLIAVLIYISLMISDVEHLLMALLLMCLSSLEKCLFRSSAHFLSDCLLFWYWTVWLLCIFWILTPYWTYHLKIFCFHIWPSLWSVFTLYPLCWEFLSSMFVEFCQMLFLYLLRWSYDFDPLFS